jgi:small GTP-binding protein
MSKRWEEERLRLSEAIAGLTEMVAQAGDGLRAEKLRELARKNEEKLAHLVFCGHFSAGKSSLINRLCGTDLLPTSPIPTSANVVTIRNGEPGARVFRRGGEAPNEQAARWEEVELDRLAALCKDGENIEAVEIRYPVQWLGAEAALLDTPGIDSTDAAHRMATESALHLADVVFYVMDYNHVQSETNFAFTKRLAEWEKPFYLIVNQIDKHSDKEMPFAAYRASVAEAFANWGIAPDGILFLSLKQPRHPDNEWPKLRWLLGSLVGMREPLGAYSLRQSLARLAEEHAAAIEEEDAGRAARLQDLAARGGDDPAALESRRGELRERLEQLERAKERYRLDLRKEIAGILDNANITPPATRDLAHHYLQSRKPGFKVGFFRSAARTAKEIAAREQAFRDDFAEKVKVHLEWHVKDELKKALARIDGETGDLAERIDGLTAELTPQWLAGLVQSGAGFTSEYTMTYCRLLAAEVKETYRRQSFALADEMAEAYGARAARQAEQLARDLAAVDEQLAARRELAEMSRRHEEYRRRLAELVARDATAERPKLPDWALTHCDPSALSALADEAAAGCAEAGTWPAAAEQAGEVAPAAVSAGRREATSTDAGAGAAGMAAAEDAGRAGSAAEHQNRMRRMADRLREAAQCLADFPAMKTAVQAMREKEARLGGRTFVVALFGAFSAGKSSFANALIGERALPVSPNPTTAAICRIVPPRDGWEHGSAKVVLKSQKQVQEDIAFSLRALGYESGDLADTLKRISGLKLEQTGAQAKLHYAFLKAVGEGWAEAEPLLGQTLKVDSAKFAEYAADERKSCFVDFIELYHANPLTDHGMVLVDTPGADSVNARHTGVAFNYIKNADAILFVTYYNHAFSHADREFLLQLGRVKDSFELDKMFFLVNAADLAATEEELTGVVGHVENNLLQHGIRRPRIYPVSSRLALEGKLRGEPQLAERSGIGRFERDFLHFCVGELAEMAVRSARFEIERAVSVLDEWLEGARESEERRRQRMDELERAEAAALERLESPDTSGEEREIAREVSELIYYVRQRSGFRFGEFFNLAFNPATLRDDGNIRRAMAAAWNELHRLVAFDLEQEVLATTLRVENVLNRLAEGAFNAFIDAIRASLPSFRGPELPSFAYETPEPAERLEDSRPDPKWLASFFRNGKSFFEGNGKAKLKAELEPLLGELAARYLERCAGLLTESYTEQYLSRIGELAALLAEAVREHAAGLREALEMKADVARLEQARRRLKEIAAGARED